MKNQAAFPRPQFNPQGVGFEDAGLGNDAQDGMTLRDYFAAAALTGMLSHIQAIPQKCVDVSFEIADAMLKARE